MVLAMAAALAASGTGSARAAVHTRKEIHKLTATEIDNFRKGVELMKDRSKDPKDPTSWIYQANIHAYPGPGENCPVIGTPQTAWGTCQHRSFFFLSWHRMYIYYFERILRAAVREAIQNSTYEFSLPFWDYENKDFRRLPEPFRKPTTNNPLYVKERRAVCNNGQECVSASDVADDKAMDLIPFCSCTGGNCNGCTVGLPSLQSFGGGFIPRPAHFDNNLGQLEAQPHNVIHGAVGGFGWMSNPDCAARDPIFFLHHANIDRLWQVWLNKQGGRTNPITNSTWGKQTFTFFDENKKKVTLTGCQVVNMASQLDYQYEGVPVKNVPLCGTAKLAPEVAAPAAAAPKTLAAVTAETTLGKAPVSVKVALPAATRQHLRALAAPAARPARLWVAIEGLKQLHAGAIYQVYLNLPPGAKPDPAGPNFLGNIALFVPPSQAEEETWTFDLASKVKAMGGREDVQLTFVREQLGPPEAGEPDTFLRFKQVSVLER
jgi:tyrosinase